MKKILVVVKEDSAGGMQRLMSKLTANDVILRPFFIQPYESLVSHPSINSFIDPILYTDYSISGAFAFNDDEKKLLSSWINSSSWLNGSMHGREYYDASMSDVISYLQLCMEYYIKVIDFERPDIIFDFESDNAIRAVLELACRRSGVRYKVAFNTRLLGTVIFGDGVIDPFSNVNFSNLSASEVQESDVLNYENYISTLTLSEDEIKFVKKNSSISLLGTIRSTLNSTIAHLHRIFASRNTESYNSPFLTGYKFSFVLWVIFRNFRYYLVSKINNNKRFHDSIDYNKLIYFPLGQIVEGSEPSFSNGWPNDLVCLELLKAQKPFGYEIIVKDHRSMMIERPLWQYKLIANNTTEFIYGGGLNKLDSFVGPTYFMAQCAGTVGLSGTSISESLLLGKPTYIFGKPFILNMIEYLRGKSSEQNLSDIASWHTLNKNESIGILKWVSRNCYNFSLYSLKRWDGNYNLLSELEMNEVIRMILDCIYVDGAN